MAYSVAILGAGYIADWHCRALRGGRLVAVCDRDAGRAKTLADRYRIPQTFTDVHAMLADAKPDAVHVLLPPEHHFAAAEQILRANVHVLLEKPMALTMEECRKLDDLAQKHGRTVGVSHNFLFAPVYERLRADVRAGKLGRLDQVTITWAKELGQIRGGPFGGWLFRDPANVLVEVGPHSVAHLLDLLGDPGKLAVESDRAIELSTGALFCRRWRARTNVGETAVDLNWSFEAGHTEHVIHVRGSAGSATADLERGTYVLHRGGASGQDDLDRRASTIGEGRTLAWQGHANFTRYALSKFKLSRRGSLFGDSIARSLAAFYAGLPSPTDERLSAAFAGRVVELCGRIGASAVPAPPSPILGDEVPAQRVARGDEGKPQSPSPPTPLPKWERGEKPKPDCLILGGTGFIGQALVRRLVDAGHSMRLLVRDPAGLPKSLRDLPLDVVRGDLNNPDSLDQALAGVRDVFHLARGNGKTYDDFVRTDLKPTEAVAAACLKHNVHRLIYTGTIDSFDTSRAITIDDTTPLDANSERRNPYSRVKADAERYLLDLHATKKLPVVILRPGVVIGVGASPFHWGAAWWPGPFVARLWGRGTNPLPLVLVDDVARAIARAADVDGIDGETFNLVAETDITARDYIAALHQATGTWIDVRPRTAMRYYGSDLLKYVVKVLVRHPGRRRPSYRDWAARGQYARFDCTKAKQLLGWQPVTDRATLLREGIERPAVDWTK